MIVELFLSLNILIYKSPHFPKLPYTKFMVRSGRNTNLMSNLVNEHSSRASHVSARKARNKLVGATSATVQQIASGYRAGLELRVLKNSVVTIPTLLTHATLLGPHHAALILKVLHLGG